MTEDHRGPYHLGFLMDQIAGHVTNYQNLRRVVADDPSIQPTWGEVHYYRAGGSIERIRERFVPFVPTYFTGNARGAIEFRRSVRGRPFDAVFCNASVGVLFTRYLRRTPTLYDFDSTPAQLDRMEHYTPRPDPKPVAQLKWRMTRRLFRSATLLHAWSNWAKQSVIDDYGISSDKVVVNPPGVDLDLWHPTAAQRAPGAPRRVLFVGGDFVRKGGPMLLDWYRKQRPADVELHVVTRDAVDDVPGVVVHRDMRPNSPELVALYGGMDVFVLPSLAECFGIATIEAMATGLPVIASDVGGTADIVEPGRNGYITRAGDTADLAAALDGILRDPGTRAAMGAQSRQIAEQRFNVVTNATRTLDLLKGLADRRPITAVSAISSERAGDVDA
jgi:glycosyltransferase involved in cell wall biosynthesis